ncbi:MAG: substrate-binding domain-containing protein [Lentisphaeria bacterium]|jgi:LacI family transcriptional regulator
MPTKLVNTKHFQMASRLREQIRGMQPGEVLPRVSDLIAEFGASQATVDRAIARLRREGLVCRPAGKQRLVVAEFCDPALRRVVIVRPDYPSELFETVTRIAVEAGRAKDWAFDYTYYRSLERLDLERAMGENDAAILQLTGEPLPKHLREVLCKPRKPVVLVQARDERLTLPSVCPDDARMAALAVEHFAALGHRQLAILLPSCESWPMRQALAGWRAALARQGCADSGLGIIDCCLKPFERALDGAYQTLRQWLAANRPPTGLYAATTHAGMGALRALREAGIEVPRQMSLIVSSGLGKMADYLYPPATSVEYDLEQYGQAIIGSLEQAIERPELPPRHVTVEPYLVIRESTRRLAEMVPILPA